MLVLVLGGNLLLTFLGWEGVGTCSYFLISFWFEKEANASRRQEGLRHQPRRRLGLHGRHVRRLLHLRHAELHRVPPGGRRRRRPDHGHDHRRDALRRRHRQVGPDPALHLAARRHGRPHAGLRAHPRRHHGHRRRLPDVPHQPGAVAASADWVPTLIAWIGRHHRARGRHHRHRPDGHQEGAGVLDGQPARLHVPGRRRRRLLGRHLPHDHPRLLQGLPVPRLRLGDPRDARRAGHAAHGQPHASSCRSPPSRSCAAGWPSPASRRSRASGRRTRSSPTPCTTNPALYAVGPVRRAAHRLLHEPGGVPDLLRRREVAGRAGARATTRPSPTRSPPRPTRSAPAALDRGARPRC